jgi:phage host-nuclease inhibitor protein Gam
VTEVTESPAQLQKALDGMWDYCNKNKLTANNSKTKIVIFSKGKVKRFPEFKLGNVALEVIGQYTYLHNFQF